MRIDLPVTTPRVLLRAPGPRVAETVHALLDAGAVVDVVSDSDPTPVLADLSARGLVRLATEPDLTAYDLVLRDPRTAVTEPTKAAEGRSGRVVLVGGGPGAPGLLTLAGLQALREADVVVCDRLAPLGLLDDLEPRPEVIHVGKIPRGAFTPQEQINELLVQHARAGRTVVRLKGGDAFVLGRGGEEWNACTEAGVPVNVVPGVSSATSAPALAGIPVTHRDLTQGFVVVSGHVPPEDPRSSVDWAAVARTGMTVVVLMGVAALESITAALQAGGMPPTTPAACIADAGTQSQQVVRATVQTLGAAVAAAGLRPPAVTVVGPVVDALQEHPAGAHGQQNG